MTIEKGCVNMERILQRVNSAFRLISSLSVSGDSVDIVAEARNDLRVVYAEVKKLAAEQPKKEEKKADE